jgi:hypothetical protein
MRIDFQAYAGSLPSFVALVLVLSTLWLGLNLLGGRI